MVFFPSIESIVGFLFLRVLCFLCSPLFFFRFWHQEDVRTCLRTINNPVRGPARPIYARVEKGAQNFKDMGRKLRYIFQEKGDTGSSAKSITDQSNHALDGDILNYFVV